MVMTLMKYEKILSKCVILDFLNGQFVLWYLVNYAHITPLQARLSADTAVKS